MANPNGDAMSVDMRDAKLTTTEAKELAQLLIDQPRLTAVDVRGNETMGLEGARALAGFIDSVCGRGVVGQQPRSLCGVTPGHSSLEVPKNLSPVDIRLVCAELSTHVFSEGIGAGMGGKTKGTVLNRRGAAAANEWQVFLWAAKENRLDLVELLLAEFGCDVNEQQPPSSSSNCFSALHWAATKGLEEMVTVLLKRGAKKETRDKHNNTALMLAEKKGNVPMVVLLGGDAKSVKKGVAED